MAAWGPAYMGVWALVSPSASAEVVFPADITASDCECGSRLGGRRRWWAEATGDVWPVKVDTKRLHGSSGAMIWRPVWRGVDG